MNDALVSLLKGAGIGDILIPRKDFIQEHKHIVGLLRKYDIPELSAEANKQAKELKAVRARQSLTLRETGVDMTGGSMGFAREHQARIQAYNALPPAEKAKRDALAKKRRAKIMEEDAKKVRFSSMEEYEAWKAEKERKMREYEESQKKGFFGELGDSLLGIARGIFGSGITHRMSVLKKYKLEDKPYSIAELSKISKVPESILQEVYNRGVGAHKTQGKSVRLKHSFVKNVDAPMSAKLSKEQWGMARIYSFLNGNPAHDEDLRSNKGGFSKQSGFIRRMMAENRVKHQGQYRKPTWPLHKDSTMNEPAEFEFRKLANQGQRGFNTSDYGASPFIIKHFGTVRAVPFERKRGVEPPLVPFSKKKSKKEAPTQETEQQKVARRGFEEEQKTPETVRARQSLMRAIGAKTLREPQVPTPQVQPQAPTPQDQRVATPINSAITRENYDDYIDKYLDSESNARVSFFLPNKGWSVDGGETKWTGYYIEDGKSNKAKPEYIIEPGINLKTVITERGENRYDRVIGEMTSVRARQSLTLRESYFIPPNECVLKKGDETIEIQQVKIIPLYVYGRDKNRGWSLYRPQERRARHIDREIRHRHIEMGVKTKKGSFTFTLESQLELEKEIDIGLSASEILLGPRKTYQQQDVRARQSLTLREDQIHGMPRREEQLSLRVRLCRALTKSQKKYETEVLRWKEQRKFDDMVLTINGKRYRMFDKKYDDKYPRWSREDYR